MFGSGHVARERDLSVHLRGRKPAHARKKSLDAKIDFLLMLRLKRLKMNLTLELALKRLASAQNLNPEKIIEIFQTMFYLMDDSQESLSLLSTFLNNNEIKPGDYVPTITFSLMKVPNEQSD